MDEEYDEPELATPRLAVLTPAQKEYFLSQLAGLRRALFRPRAVTSFNRATTWALKVFALDVVSDSDFFPNVSFGAAFDGITEYISRRHMDADAEEVVESEDS